MLRVATSLRSLAKRIYHRIPVRYRSDVNFLRRYKFHIKSQWWDREDVEQYQLRRIRAIIERASRDVPYYRQLYETAGIRGTQIKALRDLEMLPFLGKSDIAQNPSSLVSDRVDRKALEYFTTGGTSGTPVGLYLHRRNEIEREACDWRAFNWMGYAFGDRCAVLRGTRARDELGNPCWWQVDTKRSRLFLSSYDMNGETLPGYVDKLREFNPAIVRGYPSSLAVLATYMLDAGCGSTLRGVRAIGTSSENLFDWQRRLIERAFGCPIYDLYGNSEQTARMAQCECRAQYHVFEEFAYVELIRADGSSIEKPGEIGEIVGTSLSNEAMPLIRHRTEDYAAWSERRCDCGRNGLRSVERVCGKREQEQVVTAVGGRIPLTALNSHSDIFDNAREIQYLQETVDELVLNIVPKPGYGNGDTGRIKEELEAKLGGHIRLRIVIVYAIPRTERGKYKYLVQKVNIAKKTEHD
jgi:phenylacetate-CoA ligase